MILLLLALASGMGTAMRSAPQIAEIGLQAFLLSGGTLEDLCGHEGMAGHGDCDLCCHNAPLIPANHDRILQAEQFYRARVLRPLIVAAANRVHDPGAPVRGPPARL